MKNAKFIILNVAALLLIIFSISAADVIYLKDGGKVEGEIIDESPEIIKVRSNIGVIQLNRNRIKSIEKKEFELTEEPKPAAKEKTKKKKVEETPKKLARPAEAKEPKANIIVPVDYPTLKEAIMASHSGDVIYIKPGEYEEKDGLRLKKGITLMGSETDSTKIIISRGGIKFEDVRTDKSASKVIIKDLTFVLQDQPFTLDYVEDVNFKNCIITGPNIGFFITASKKIEITNCTISGFYNSGISLDHGPSDVTIRNSIIANCYWYNIYVDDLSRMGIAWTNPTTGQEIPKEQKEKLMAEFKDVKLAFFYNDVWGAKNNYYNCTPGEFDFSQDPQFVGDGDFRLQPTSPCIDAGDPDEKYNDPDGTRNDLGALPYFKPSTEKEKK
ncbi:MAG: right-handed parallel beta-helix repeat-containing protein [Candidatus Omnitrophota bacterium]